MARKIKLLGLTAVVVLAAAVSAGVASASAATLCLTDTNPCTNPVPVGDVLDGTLVSATSDLLDNNLSAHVSCTSSAFEDTVTANGSGTISDSLTALDFADCTDSVLHTTCMATTLGLPWGTSITSNPNLPPPDGFVSLAIPTGGGVQVQCPELLYDCTFTGTDNPITLNLFNPGDGPVALSPPEAEVQADNVPVTSGNCGHTGTFNGVWQVTDSSDGEATIWLEPNP